MPPSNSVTRASLGVLDLVPLSEGTSPSATIQTLRRSAQRAEATDSPVISSLSDDDRQLVSDRVRTQFGGTSEFVTERLEVLQQATGADELILTSAARDADARDERLELIAREWFRR